MSQSLNNSNSQRSPRPRPSSPIRASSLSEVADWITLPAMTAACMQSKADTARSRRFASRSLRHYIAAHREAGGPDRKAKGRPKAPSFVSVSGGQCAQAGHIQR